MKSIICLFLVGFLLGSCVKYTQPKLLSLSGEYRFDKITYEKVDNTDESEITAYYPGDLYVNHSEIDVMTQLKLDLHPYIWTIV